MHQSINVPSTRRLLATMTGLTLLLGSGCDPEAGEPEAEVRGAANCGVDAEQLSTIFVDEELFEEIEGWSDPNGVELEDALKNADGMSPRSGSDSCDGIGDDPTADSSQCASSTSDLANKMMEYAGKNDGAQCLAVAGLSKFKITPDDTHAEDTVNRRLNTDRKKVTSRVSRHGPATAALLHATSQVKVDPTKPEEGSLEARKARVIVRVMNLCYDDAGNRVLNGPAARVRFQTDTHGKITIANMTDSRSHHGNSMGKGEFMTGTNRYVKSTNEWTALGDKDADNLSLTRVVSQSSWTLNWDVVIPTLIDAAAWAAEARLPAWKAFEENWRKLVNDNTPAGANNPLDGVPDANKKGSYLRYSIDQARKFFVTVGEDKGELGRTARTQEHRTNDSITIDPFDQVTYELTSSFQASVETRNTQSIGYGWQNFTSVTMASDFSVFLTVEYEKSACDRFEGQARQACYNTNPVGYFIVGSKGANNIPSDESIADGWEDFWRHNPWGGFMCAPGSSFTVYCRPSPTERSQAYSPRDFAALAEHSRIVARDFGMQDDLPGWGNNPVAEMVETIEAADAQGLTIVQGSVEVIPSTTE
ncbi:MAG: hypothetical protein AAF799_23910 [Myxococcota bacterium]